MLKSIKSKLFSLGLLLGRWKYSNRNSKVLYYHDVHEDGCVPETDMSTPMSLFKQHIELIRVNGFEIVDVITKPTNQIVLTFDDGYLGVYKNKGFFVNQGLKPTIFLITGAIGKRTFMGSDQIHELQNHGFVFQSHTHSHPDLNLLNDEQLLDEFSKSNAILEKLLKKEVKEICFPKGFFNDRTVELAYKCGYKVLYSSLPGYFKEENKFKVTFRNLVQFTKPEDLVSVLFGGARIYRNRYIKQHYHNTNRL